MFTKPLSTIMLSTTLDSSDLCKLKSKIELYCVNKQYLLPLSFV